MLRTTTTALVLALASVVSVCGDEPAEKATQLIRALSDDSQSKREAAVEALRRLGAPGVEPLTQAALSNDVEIGILAVSVLESLNLSDDAATQVAAENALDKLIRSAKPHAAQRAQEVWDRHYDQRQVRAIAFLEKHHAKIWTKDAIDGFGGAEVESKLPHIVIVGADWTGGDGAVRQIATLESVNTVFVTTGHPLSEASLDQLRKLRPDLRVDKRGSAFLGITHGPHPFGTRVGNVNPDTPAARGGLQPSDIIVDFGGFPTQAPDDLINAISRYKPGDDVNVVVLRDPANHLRGQGFRQWSVYQMVLFETMNAPEPENVLLPIAVFHSMRTELTIKLGEWTPSRLK